MIFYHCPPVDWFIGSRPFKVDSFGEILEMPKGLIPSDEDQYKNTASYVAKALARKVYIANLAFRDIGWEGDSRDGFWQCWTLPHADGDLVHWVIGVKQDNNGATFIASDVPLPYLADLAFDMKQSQREGSSG